MSSTNSSGPVVPCPTHACGVTNGTTSESVAISSANVARLLSIQRELLHLTSGWPEAVRLLEEMGRIVVPLAANPKDPTTVVAYDPISQVLGNPDILVHGLLFVSNAGLATIARVSKRWKSVLDGVEDKLWAGIAHRDEPLLFSAISGKSGRQWKDCLKRRFIMDTPPRVIRQPESSLVDLDKYVFELDLEVVVGCRDRPAPDEEDYHHAPFRFLLSASPKHSGGIILRNDNVEDARRLKTAANTALTNSPHILGESDDDGILVCEWKLRVTNKETLHSAFLLKKEEDHAFRCDKETREGVVFCMQEEYPLEYFLIRTSDDDGYAIRYVGEDGCKNLSKNNKIYSLLDSFCVSNDETNFHMKFFFIDHQNDDYDYDDLAFLLANLRWGYY